MLRFRSPLLLRRGDRGEVLYIPGKFQHNYSNSYNSCKIRKRWYNRLRGDKDVIER